jgi:hypothetical protein
VKISFSNLKNYTLKKIKNMYIFLISFYTNSNDSFYSSENTKKNNVNTEKVISTKNIDIFGLGIKSKNGERKFLRKMKFEEEEIFGDKDNQEDLSLRNLIQEILIFYGYPASVSSCISKEEKAMWVYGYFAVKFGLNTCKPVWENRYKNIEDKELALDVCESFFNSVGHHIIPTEQDLKNTEVMSSLKSGSVVRGSDVKSKKISLPRLEYSGSKEKI